jgi:hypothetical protein
MSLKLLAGRYLGHSSFRMIHQKYVHPTAEHQRALMQKYHETWRPPIDWRLSDKKGLELKMEPNPNVTVFVPPLRLSPIFGDRGRTDTNEERGLNAVDSDNYNKLLEAWWESNPRSQI